MIQALSSSFRDPSGFVFKHNNKFHRAVMPKYKSHYDLFLTSGLYEALNAQGLIIAHVEVDPNLIEDSYKVLLPEQIATISYPYEWCFSQLKQAALLTLQIQTMALEKGLILKDASAFNIQFRGSRPVFIDTLSFEKYVEGEPWVAYKQFIQHFLAPLALMYYGDVRLNQLFKQFIDGVPLDIASKLLPNKTHFAPTLLFHIHLHARYQTKYSQSGVSSRNTKKVSKVGLLGIIDQLKSYIASLEFPKLQTEWGDYYSSNNYSEETAKEKREIVAQFGKAISPKSVWDLGANRGDLSRIFSAQGISTVAWDIDPVAVEKNFQEAYKQDDKNILPLVLDLTNPSSGLGWANQERMSLEERAKVDLVMAMALIHHLTISNNVPFSKVAEFLSKLGKNLIIEFVPKSDSQVQRILNSREDIFDRYDLLNFKHAFSVYFDISEEKKIPNSERSLFLMKSKNLF